MSSSVSKPAFSRPESQYVSLSTIPLSYCLRPSLHPLLIHLNSVSDQPHQARQSKGVRPHGSPPCLRSLACSLACLPTCLTCTGNRRCRLLLPYYIIAPQASFPKGSCAASKRPWPTPLLTQFNSHSAVQRLHSLICTPPPTLFLAPSRHCITPPSPRDKPQPYLHLTLEHSSNLFNLENSLSAAKSESNRLLHYHKYQVAPFLFAGRKPFVNIRQDDDYGMLLYQCLHIDCGLRAFKMTIAGLGL